MVYSVDLNCDMGEGAGNDEALMPLISSANVACGGHAGSPAMIRHTIALAREHGVSVGAHPGFEDPAGFGRTFVPMHLAEIQSMLRRQIDRIADALSGAPAHIKPHGALYNAAAEDREIADCIAETVLEYGSILYVLAGSQSELAARRLGLPYAREAFADRNYTSSGHLVARSMSSALIADTAVAARRAVALVVEQQVSSVDGSALHLTADTLCIHGDHAGADRMAQAVRTALEAAGVRIAPPGHG